LFGAYTLANGIISGIEGVAAHDRLQRWAEAPSLVWFTCACSIAFGILLTVLAIRLGGMPREARISNAFKGSLFIGWPAVTPHTW
jgi:hypothetical protein